MVEHQSLPSVQESLAGRIRKIRLRVLSQGELLGTQPNFIDNAFKGKFHVSEKSIYDRKTMLDIAFRGGYPEAIKLEGRERRQWHLDYITALLEREKREIDFLIEREDHALLGIEVKAGSAISTADFKHLKWFKDNLAKDRPFIGIVLYSGAHVGSMGNNLWAVPFGMVWGK